MAKKDIVSLIEKLGEISEVKDDKKKLYNRPKTR